MNRVMSVGIVDILKKAQEEAANAANTDIDFEEEDNLKEEVEVGVVPEPTISQLDVDLSGVEVDGIELQEIRDEHGRISDLIESLEDCTGLSVIPLEMGHIAPEVTNLERHEIFELNGVRYAMSHRLRKKVIEAYKTRIIKVLSSGLPFKESLNASVEHDGNEYVTLQLSRDEWTYLMALFRNYKEKIYVSSDGGMYFEEKDGL